MIKKAIIFLIFSTIIVAGCGQTGKNTGTDDQLPPPDLDNEFRVSPESTLIMAKSALTSLAEGGFAAAWTLDPGDGSGRNVYLQVFNSQGVSLNAPVMMNAYTDGEQSSPALCTLQNGTIAAAWYSQGAEDAQGVYGRILQNNGTAVTEEFLINTTTANGQYAPAITSLTNGGFVTVWESTGQDGSSAGIFGQVFNSLGSKVGTEFQVNTTTESYQQAADVCGLADGGFVVAWETMHNMPADYYDIYAQRFDVSGTKVGTESTVPVTSEYYQRAPQIALLPNGNTIFVWQSTHENAGLTGIYGQIFDSDMSRVGSELHMNASTVNSQVAPDVAVLDDGSFVAVWGSNHSDTGTYEIYARRFDTSGQPVSEETRLNQQTDGNQQLPKVVPFGSGSYASIWHVHVPLYGIFGRVMPVQ